MAGWEAHRRRWEAGLRRWEAGLRRWSAPSRAALECRPAATGATGRAGGAAGRRPDRDPGPVAHDRPSSPRRARRARSPSARPRTRPASWASMKGAVMKLGQMLSFVGDALPPEAQAALAQLQADAPPMAPSLAADGRARGAGRRPPEVVFAEWDPMPVAAASIGQVHRARLPDGRAVAVKVQYPGRRRAPSGRTWPTAQRHRAPCCRRVTLPERRRGRAGRGAAASAWSTSSTTASRPTTSRRSPSATPATRSCRAGGGGRALGPAGAGPRVGRRPDLRRVRGRVADGRHASDGGRGAVPLRPGLDRPRRPLQRRPAPGQLPVRGPTVAW